MVVALPDFQENLRAMERLVADLERLVAEDSAALTREDYTHLVRNQSLKQVLCQALERHHKTVTSHEGVFPAGLKLLNQRIEALQVEQRVNSTRLQQAMANIQVERRQMRAGRKRLIDLRRGYGGRSTAGSVESTMGQLSLQA